MARQSVALTVDERRESVGEDVAVVVLCGRSDSVGFPKDVVFQLPARSSWSDRDQVGLSESSSRLFRSGNSQQNSLISVVTGTFDDSFRNDREVVKPAILTVA